MNNIIINLDNTIALAINQYAKEHGLSNEEAITSILRERFEEPDIDEVDIALCEEGVKAFEEDPTTYTLEEVIKELGLDEV